MFQSGIAGIVICVPVSGGFFNIQVLELSWTRDGQLKITDEGVAPRIDREYWPMFEHQERKVIRMLRMERIKRIDEWLR